MSFYLDTSSVVASLTNEAATPRVLNWLEGKRGLFISAWVKTEFSAALSIKVRSGALDARSRAETVLKFNSLVEETYEVLPVPAACFDSAARLADQYDLGLRAGDSLHLAIAAPAGLTLCTLDVRLAKAGQALGVSTLLI